MDPIRMKCPPCYHAPWRPGDAPARSPEPRPGHRWRRHSRSSSLWRSALARNLALPALVALLAFSPPIPWRCSFTAAPGASLTLSVDAVHTWAVRGW